MLEFHGAKVTAALSVVGLSRNAINEPPPPIDQPDTARRVLSTLPKIALPLVLLYVTT